MTQLIDLTGKKIMITGASGGIGSSVVKLLYELGADVVLLGRSEEKLKRVAASMDASRYMKCSFDLTDIEGIEPMMKDVVRRFGRLDGLVHCAGVAMEYPVKMSTYRVIHETMLLNFYSFCEMVRSFSSRKRNNGGSIVLLSSVAASECDKAMGIYSASKSAGEAIMRSWAKELCSKNIRLNAVVPGMVNTDMYQGFINTFGENHFEEHILSKQYLGLIEPEEIAKAVAYLLSDASRCVTGSKLAVDGGFLS